MDDFAPRKRFSYGTVNDPESHRIIDLLPSRETSDAARWFAAFPNIQVVSRDGAAIYSSAMADSHPEAIQVSDRFHLIKGLSEAVNKYMIRKFPARVEIPLPKDVSEEMKALAHKNERKGWQFPTSHCYCIHALQRSGNTLLSRKMKYLKANRLPAKGSTGWQCSKNSRKLMKPGSWRRMDIR